MDSYVPNINRKAIDKPEYIPAGNSVFDYKTYPGPFTIHLPRADDLRYILYLHHCTDAVDVPPNSSQKMRELFLWFFQDDFGPSDLGVVYEYDEGNQLRKWTKEEDLLKDPLGQLEKRLLHHPFFEYLRQICEERARKEAREGRVRGLLDLRQIGEERARKEIREGLIRGVLDPAYSSDEWRSQGDREKCWRQLKLDSEPPNEILPLDIVNNKGSQFLPGSMKCWLYFDEGHGTSPTARFAVHFGEHASVKLAPKQEGYWLFSSVRPIGDDLG